jgi:hypothetical protein
MNALKIFGFAAVLITLMSGGCGIWDGGKNDQSIIQGPEPKSVSDLPKVSGGMVLPVNNERITIDEVIAPITEDLQEMAAGKDYLDFRVKAKPLIDQTVSNRVSNITLYQKAKREAREGIDEQLNKAAEGEVRQFVSGFDGNYAEAERAIKKMGMNWKTYLDYQKRLIMVQAYLADEFKEDKNPVTYSDLVSYYERVKDEDFRTPTMLQFRLIDIVPSLMTPTEPNQTRLGRAKQVCAEIWTNSARVKISG